MKTKNYSSTSNHDRALNLDLNLNRNRNREFNRKSQIRNRKSLRQQLTRSRAAWWFGQMRKAVEAAPDWKPVPAWKGSH